MFLRMTSVTPSSVNVSPALSVRSATATLSGGESLITARSGRSVRSRSLELAILLVRRDRVHAADQRAAHVAFGRNHLLGLRDDLLRDCARDDHHAIAVAQQIVTGCKGDRADGD